MPARPDPVPVRTRRSGRQALALRPSRPRSATALAALTLAVTLASCSTGAGGPTGDNGVTAGPTPARTATATAGPTTPTPEAASTPPPAASAGSALALLATLPVKGRAPRTGYDREKLFGPPYADLDRNGCDQRNDVLRRDLSGVAFRPGTRECVVVSGELDDPYTGRALSFVKADAMAVQIDHVVALSNAWQTGAQSWPESKRIAFANDLLNLLAVDGPTNSAKGDADAATWLPPDKAFRCAYVARQIAVKARYGLWMTAAEKEASARTLAPCPDEPAPSAPPAVPAPSAPPVPPPPGAAAVDPRFASCREALAAGYGPYTVGRDPEAGWYRDGDGDGIVCEPPM